MKKSKKVILYVNKYTFQDEDDEVTINTYEPSCSETVLFDEIEIDLEYNCPDNFNLAKLKAMRSDKEKLIADTQIKIEKADSEIQKLMALTVEYD